MRLLPLLAAAATTTAATLAQAPPPAAPAPAPAAPAPAPAAPAPAPAPAAAVPQAALPTQAKALLVYGPKDFKDVWIERATATQFRYRETETAIDRKIETITKCEAVYFYEPLAYTAARDLYQGRRYEEARELFGRIRESLRELRAMPNNHSSLAAFYQLECMRHLGDLAALAAGAEDFREEAKGSLTRPHHLRQVELYTLWSAVHTKSWDRLARLCADRRKEPMPGYQRAQVAYCHGLALEGLKQPVPALNAYATALTADCGDSGDLVRQAALNSLRLYKSDPEVQLAIKLWGTEDADPNAAGRFRLLEAAALAITWQDLLGGGQPLPKEFLDLPKYKEKEKPAEPGK